MLCYYHDPPHRNPSPEQGKRGKRKKSGDGIKKGLARIICGMRALTAPPCVGLDATFFMSAAAKKKHAEEEEEKRKMVEKHG